MFHSLEKSLLIESIGLPRKEFKEIIEQFKEILNDFVTKKGN